MKHKFNFFTRLLNGSRTGVERTVNGRSHSSVQVATSPFRGLGGSSVHRALCIVNLLITLGIMPMWADNVITVAFQKKDVGRELYMHDDGSTLIEYDGSSSADASKWRKIPANKTVQYDGKYYTAYYLQNVSTGKYLYPKDFYDLDNDDWDYYTTAPGDKSDNNLYKWFFGENDNNTWVIFNCGGINSSNKYHSFHLHACNQDHTICTNAPIPKVICGASGDYNVYSRPAISESWASTPACAIPNGTTIYVDVTNFTGGQSGDGNYYLSIVGTANNASIDLCQKASSYTIRDDQWITMTQVEGKIYKAEITTNEKNSSLICIWNKNMHDWGNPHQANLAGMTAYDCTTGNNLYTIKENFVSSNEQDLRVFTGTWSSYTPVDPCPNCGTVSAK